MPSKLLKAAVCLFVGSSACVVVAAQAGSPGHAGYVGRTDVSSFIHELHTGHGIDRQWTERILAEARHQPRVVRLIGPPPTPTATPAIKRPRSYPAYRSRFLTPSRIDAGVQYWAANEETLSRAEAEYGVPAEVILGILGVETAFGQNTGSFRVLDALATIAFDGPRRQEYFREELAHFLVLTHEIGADPVSIKGSYAGAMGLPQFMPSSYRRFAVDYDRDGKVDLLGTPADAIGSVARYLREHGWRDGEAPAVQLTVQPELASPLVSGLNRSLTLSALKEQGLTLPTISVADEACALIELPARGAPPSFWVTFANFEAVTRYNRSTFYAAAVLELADAIRVARLRPATSTASNTTPLILRSAG